MLKTLDPRSGVFFMNCGVIMRLCADQSIYDRLISWAEIYSVCPFETKKMFISQFVKPVRVYRDYELEIEFNVSFEEFWDLRVRE